MTTEAKSVSEILKTILATTESVGPVQITENCPGLNSYASKMRTASPTWRRNWLKSRLGLSHYHPDVKLIEDAVWDFCVGIAACPGRGKRLVFFGNNGNGKSKSCRAIRRFIQDRAVDLPLVLTLDGDMALISCCLINWAQKVDEFKRTQQWDIEDLIDSTVLMIDDIGAEHDPSKIGLERLYLILERREFKWTIITTNKQPDSWEQSFERRIADRLFRNADHVDLSKLPSFAVNEEK